MQLNRKIQRTLTRQDVNLQSITFTAFGGQVKIEGRLENNQGEGIKNPQEVRNLEKQVKRLDGVYRVQWDLDEWSKDDGTWKQS